MRRTLVFAFVSVLGAFALVATACSGDRATDEPDPSPRATSPTASSSSAIPASPDFEGSATISLADGDHELPVVVLGTTLDGPAPLAQFSDGGPYGLGIGYGAETTPEAGITMTEGMVIGVVTPETTTELGPYGSYGANCSLTFDRFGADGWAGSFSCTGMTTSDEELAPIDASGSFSVAAS